MGRVFQYAEVEAGRIPDIADFQAAADTFVKQSTIAIEQGHVDGAFIFGSVAGLLNSDSRATPNQRSDMDCFVVISDYSTQALASLRSLVEAVNESTNARIPASPIVYQRQQLEEGYIAGTHELDTMFGTDLTGQGRFVIGNDPAGYMQFPQTSPFDMFNSFIAQKRRKLHNGLAQKPESEEGVRTVQRFLELPLSMGRKAVQALMLSGEHLDDDFWAADKRRVLDVTATKLFDGDEVPIGLMQAIVDYDREYNNLLAYAKTGRMTESTYNEALRRIADYSTGIQWLSYVHRAIGHRLQQATGNPLVK